MGVEPATFQFVVQGLNQLGDRVPAQNMYEITIQPTHIYDAVGATERH